MIFFRIDLNDTLPVWFVSVVNEKQNVNKTLFYSCWFFFSCNLVQARTFFIPPPGLSHIIGSYWHMVAPP